MNEYIFYTAEGYTDAPNESCEIENCQLLGRACGRNKSEAQKNLLEENPWIIEVGFDSGEFFVEQVLTKEQRANIQLLIDYLWQDEERRYEESEDKSSHIFNVLRALKGI
ncbi:MAG: hypothetical protein K2I99_00580 [Bacteroidaceae bacterium]|nr:hypothetical protein [Bacteroidaceae bacterium]